MAGQHLFADAAIVEIQFRCGITTARYAAACQGKDNSGFVMDMRIIGRPIKSKTHNVAFLALVGLSVVPFLALHLSGGRGERPGGAALAIQRFPGFLAQLLPWDNTIHPLTSPLFS